MKSRTANWFLCKIRYLKTMEDGIQKKVTEQYVVEATGFAEAEAYIINGCRQHGIPNDEFEVAEIDRCAFKEVFFMSDGAKMFHNEVKDMSRALIKGDKKMADEVYNRPLEERNNTDTRWYKSKLQFVIIDEKTEKEKKTNVYYLVEGCSLENARQNIDTVMDGSMLDYVISSVSETNILDVFVND